MNCHNSGTGFTTHQSAVQRTVRSLLSGSVFFLAVAGFLASVSSAPAQVTTTYYWANFVGQPGGAGTVNGTGSAARVDYPYGVTVDRAGNVYVAEPNSSLIRQVTPAGVVTTVAGSAGLSGSADGTNGAARFSGPFGMAVDTNGNVYVADCYNKSIRKLTPVGTNWVVTTVAGNGVVGNTDGTNGTVRFNFPQGVAVDSGGNVFVADTRNHSIRMLTPVGTNWVATTLAGSATNGAGYADGTNSAALFNNPNDVAVDSTGNLFVADWGNHSIRKLTPVGTNWVVTTVAGNGVGGYVDGTNSAARLRNPGSLAVDTNNNVFVADTYNNAIRKLTPVGTNWVVTTVAGTGSTGSADGTNSAARFYIPYSLAVDSAGKIFVADTYNSTVRQVTPVGANWVVTTLVGMAKSTGKGDGLGNAARFNSPQGVALDTSNNLYVADTSNHLLRQVTTGGVVMTLAGNGSSGSADGTNSAARFSNPYGVAVDSTGSVMVVDTGNHTIRKATRVGTNWVVTTLAGSAGNSGNTDGTNSAARFNGPFGVAVDGNGTIFVADTYNHTIRQVTSAGTNWVVTTLAGSAGHPGNSDGTNSAARFQYPAGVAVDANGKIYVADYENNTVRQLTPVGTNWVVMTLAGSAGNSGSTDGTNNTARFNYPQGVTVAADGTVFVSDTSNHTIRKLTPTGTNWVVTTIGGTASVMGGADGTGSAALFADPYGIVADSAGILYVADSGNNRITRGTPSGQPLTAIISVQASPADGGSASGSGLYTAGTNLQIAATANDGWTFTGWDDGNTNTARVVSVPLTNLTFTASFVREQATVSVQADPANGGSVSGGGTAFVGTNLQISETVNSGWSFTGWSDGDTNITRLVPVPLTNITYTALYVPVATIGVFANPANGGTVSGGGPQVVGASVQIIATANSGWRFTSWSDGNTNATRMISVPAGGGTYTANFQRQTVSVTVQANPSNGGTVSGSGTYTVGTNVQISAVAKSGWSFTGWSDGGANALRTISVPVGGATYTANFAIVFSGGAPVFLTPPVITNALLVIGKQFVVVAGETNGFTVSAADPVDNNRLRYQWRFGDGATSAWSAAAGVMHIYATNNCGSYTASVTVSNDQSAISSNLTVSAACQLTLTKLQVGLSFIKTNLDKCAVTGKLVLPGITNVNQLTGVVVVVDVGNAQAPFALDGKGRGASGLGTCRLAYTKATKTKQGYWTATLALSKGSWQGQWAQYGLDNATHKSPGVSVTVPVVVVIGAEAFAAERTLHYTATVHKTGTAK